MAGNAFNIEPQPRTRFYVLHSLFKQLSECAPGGGMSWHPQSKPGYLGLYFSCSAVVELRPVREAHSVPRAGNNSTWSERRSPKSEKLLEQDR
jgi:hypothetical protein